MSLLDTASLIVTPNGYKEGKLYSVIPSDGSGDMSVVRATTATRVNSAGLVELVPYNLFEYSEQFDNAYWTKIHSSVTANATTAPNSTTTADKLIEDNTSNVHHLLFPNITPSGTNTLSVYAKAGERNWVWLYLFDGVAGSLFAWFDVSNGTLGSVNSGLTANIESVGNGWYRCSITRTQANTGNGGFGVTNGNGTISYVGNGTSGAFFWGAQLVEGSTAKDYQKTETRLNIPRLDYSNGTCPSLLVEPQRTNELLYSSSFSSAAWNIRSNIAIDLNSTTSPDGNTNAAKMRVTNNSICDYGAFEVLTSGTRVFSVFAKKAELGYLYLGYENNVPSEGVFFNLNDGTVSQNTSGLTANIEDFGNGWYRCSVNLVNKTNHFISPSANGTSFALTNQQNNGIYIWGAQAELGSYSTSYIPTTSASVTRNADVISKTGISSLIGQTEGTLFWEGQGNTQSVGDDLWIFGTFANDTSVAVLLYYVHSSGYINCYINNGSSFVNLGAPLNITNNNKIAVGYKNGDFAMYANGTLIDSNTSATAIPSGMNQVAMNKWQGATGVQKQQMKAAALWTTRLTNAQLQQLSSI
jgi:hypothetical protein